MALDILYFAWVREIVDRDHERIELPDHVATVGALVDWLAQRGGAYAEAFGRPERLRAAIDQGFVGLDAPLAGAREIALFPPVTGG